MSTKLGIDGSAAGAVKAVAIVAQPLQLGGDENYWLDLALRLEDDVERWKARGESMPRLVRELLLGIATLADYATARGFVEWRAERRSGAGKPHLSNWQPLPVDLAS